MQLSRRKKQKPHLGYDRASRLVRTRSLKPHQTAWNTDRRFNCRFRAAQTHPQRNYCKGSSTANYIQPAGSAVSVPRGTVLNWAYFVTVETRYVSLKPTRLDHLSRDVAGRCEVDGSGPEKTAPGRPPNRGEERATGPCSSGQAQCRRLSRALSRARPRQRKRFGASGDPGHRALWGTLHAEGANGTPPEAKLSTRTGSMQISAIKPS